jgi:two-component sensor histidine kinase
MSLRRRLAVLVAISLMPPFLLTLYNTVRWQLVLEKEARDEALAAARLVSSEFSQIIDGSRQLMTAMSRHPAVPDREEECAAYFKAVIVDIPIYREAAFIDTSGKFHCSTIPIPPTLDVSDRVYFREPLETGELTIGTLVQGRVTRGSSIHLSLPNRGPDGAIKGITVLILNPEQLAQDLAARPWRSRHRVMVLDREGTLVLTVPRDAADDARRIAGQIFPTIKLAGTGVIEAKDAHGSTEIVAYAPAHHGPSSLFVAVGIDRDVALSEAWTINARSLAFALITMLLAIGVAWIATHMLINRPIRALVRTARRRESGETDAPFPSFSFSTEFEQLSAALSRMSDKIHDLVEQKSFLLRELQHRVMNSLTLLSSVLEMQRRSARSAPAKEHLARARDRVVAMGTVYRFLYQTDTSETVEFGDFLRVICEESQNAYSGAQKPTISVQADQLRISGSHAIALAMLTHELITNALKHAYPEGAPGSIDVTLTRTSDGVVQLRVADHGQGLPEDFDVSQSGSLGMKVIASTAQQLGGTLDIRRTDPGTEFVIRVPEERLRPKKTSTASS